MDTEYDENDKLVSIIVLVAFNHLNLIQKNCSSYDPMKKLFLLSDQKMLKKRQTWSGYLDRIWVSLEFQISDNNLRQYCEN